jgi:uncharacterized protein HemX
MTDPELQSRLQSLPVPTRTEEYWDDFPAHIRRQLRAHSATTPKVQRGTRPIWALNLAFALGLILVFGVQLRAAQLAGTALHRQEKAAHLQLARLDLGLHKLLLANNGLSDQLIDAN